MVWALEVTYLYLPALFHFSLQYFCLSSLPPILSSLPPQVTLQRLIAILESVEKLERLLKITRSTPGSETSEIEQLAQT